MFTMIYMAKLNGTISHVLTVVANMKCIQIIVQLGAYRKAISVIF